MLAVPVELEPETQAFLDLLEAGMLADLQTYATAAEALSFKAHQLLKLNQAVQRALDQENGSATIRQTT
jgi:outer membrane PBP1 activator LpoA protein